MPFTDKGEHYWIGPSGHIYFGCLTVPVEPTKEEST